MYKEPWTSDATAKALNSARKSSVYEEAKIIEISFTGTAGLLSY